MTIQEQRRKAFQDWWQADAQSELRASCAPGWGEYIWNAALDSVEVVLPSASGFDVPSFAVAAIDECRAAIEASGVRVKR